MRVVPGARHTVARCASAGMAQWRTMQPGRRIVAWIDREPIPGCIGVMYLITAAPALAVLLLVHGLVPGQPFAAVETGIICLIGAALYVMAHLARWRRR